VGVGEGVKVGVGVNVGVGVLVGMGVRVGVGVDVGVGVGEAKIENTPLILEVLPRKKIIKMTISPTTEKEIIFQNIAIFYYEDER